MLERVNTGAKILNPYNRNSMFANSLQIEKKEDPVAAMSNASRVVGDLPLGDLMIDLNKDSSTRYNNKAGRGSSLVSVQEWNKIKNKGSDGTFNNSSN